ncbi:MAG: hypothetical protein ACRD7E_04205, partial [Bryobacteraceae bacterium]
LSEAATAASRIPAGHVEGFLEAFANIYAGAVEAIRRHIDGSPMDASQYNFPTVYDGLRGMQFIYKAIESADHGSRWITLPPYPVPSGQRTGTGRTGKP